MLRGVIICAVSGCAVFPHSEHARIQHADRIAQSSQLDKRLIPTQSFLITVYERLKTPGRPLYVYLEGDGYAWVSLRRPSGNPTPRNPIALRLAALDPAENVVYVARPCQYTPRAEDSACEVAYWTERRFSEEVIASLNEALERLVQQGRPSETHLVGFSGGGTIALLIAARRTDITDVRTVAGNLNPEAVNRSHGVGMSQTDMNPMDVAAALAALPQQHFIGTRDAVVPAAIARSYFDASGKSRCVQVISVEGATHETGWLNRWQELLKTPFACAE